MGKLVIYCALLVGFLPAISASVLSDAVSGELTARSSEHSETAFILLNHRWWFHWSNWLSVSL